jgi:uncharacterized membrane protein
MNTESNGDHSGGVPSRAAIAGHPIHPMLIPFPIAFFVGALVTDLVFLLTGDPFWARTSLWLIVGGLAGGLIAAIFGLTDFLTIPRVREHSIGWIHALGNGTVLLLSLVNLLLRLANPQGGVLPWGLLLSFIVTGILVVTGWFGGELAYRHMVGVIGHKGR